MRRCRPGAVTVERERTIADRMRGRPGEVQRVNVRLGEQVMSLGVRRGQPVAEICHEVRGVVLSRQQVRFDEWADALARLLSPTPARTRVRRRRSGGSSTGS